MGKIIYKSSAEIRVWLDMALKMEKKKYSTVPVTSDMSPHAEVAKAWGYVVAGYSLMEQGFKAVLHMRGVAPPKTHALHGLFIALPTEDQAALKVYYDDFFHASPGMDSFPLTTLEEFLKNLDGESKNRDRHTGSLDWRYFPIEENSSPSMPLVCIDFMHEVVYACVWLIASIHNEDNEVDRGTYSWRLQWERVRLYKNWLTVRMNPPGREQEGDRLEILWGPDYKGRYDFCVFQGGRQKVFFQPLPKPEEIKITQIDKRKEIDSFDSEEGLRSIGVFS